MTDPAPESRTDRPGPRPGAFPPGPLAQVLAVLAWTLAWMALEAQFQRHGIGPALRALAPLLVFLAVAGGFLLWARDGVRGLVTGWPVPAGALAGTGLVGLVAGWGVVLARGGEVLPGSLLGGPLSILATSRVSDLFRSLWLESLLLPLAGLGLGVAWRGGATRRTRPAGWLAAAGLALLAAAAVWNQAGSLRLVQRMTQGDTAGVFGTLLPGGDPVALPGFRVRLDRLEATPRNPAFRLATLPEASGKGGGVPWTAHVESGQGGDLPGGLRYQVEKLIPDALPSGRVEEVPQGPENPALQVMLGLGNTEPLVGVLFSRDPDGWRREEPQGRFAVVYRDRFEPGLLLSLRPHPPTRQRLVLTFLGRTLEHPVRLGDTWELPGFSLTVLGIFPDFGGLRPGPDGKPAFFSRSPLFRNPWLQVRLRQAGGAQADLLLSARPVQDKDYTDYLARTLPPGLALAYEPLGAELQDRFVVLTREDGKVRLVQDGRVLRTADVVVSQPFLVEKGLSITVLAKYDHARFVPDFVPDPDVDVTARSERPVLRLRVWDPATGAAESHWLQARGDDGQPVGAAFLGGRVRLEYRSKDPDPRDLRATLAVLDPAGHELASGPLGTGQSLACGGFRFYLDGATTGSVRILAVRDPGLGLAWIGLGALALGILGLAAGRWGKR